MNRLTAAAALGMTAAACAAPAPSAELSGPAPTTAPEPTTTEATTTTAPARVTVTTPPRQPAVEPFSVWPTTEDEADPMGDDAYRARILACIRRHESDNAGGYRAYNERDTDGRPASGGYQFKQATWDDQAERMGRFDLVGVDPRDASPADQDAVAWALYLRAGFGPWPTPDRVCAR